MELILNSVRWLWSTFKKSVIQENIIYEKFDPSTLDPYNRIMLAWPGELDCEWDDIIVGRLPFELQGGTFWINGPGKIVLGGRLVHPFDGSGYLRAIRFMGSKIRLQAKMIRTRVFEDEDKAGKPVWVGLATLPSASFWQNLRAPGGRNVSNTCVLPWAGKILTLWEGGLPHAVDPHTLETIGPENFRGALAPGDSFLAHTRIDAQSGNLIGLSPRIRGPTIDFTCHEFDSDERLVASVSAKLDSFSVVHDFAITPRQPPPPLRAEGRRRDTRNNGAAARHLEGAF